MDKVMSWKEIEGFGEHDFEGFYRKIVEVIRPGGIFVETGCFHGRSLCQIAQYAKEIGKDMRIVGIDHGIGQSEGLADTIRVNLQKCGVDEMVQYYQDDAVKGAVGFMDESVDFVFLDDDHSHPAVSAAVDAWMPKLRAGGWLCGHDAKWYSVWEPLWAKLEKLYHDPTWPNVWFAPKQPIRPNVDIYASVRLPGRSGDAMFGYGSCGCRNDGMPAGSPFPE